MNRLAPLLVAGLLVTACGGGGGGGDGELDGWWELTSRAVGASGPYDPEWFGYGAQEGATWVYRQTDFAWDGVTLAGGPDEVREAVLRRAAAPTGDYTIERTYGADAREA